MEITLLYLVHLISALALLHLSVATIFIIICLLVCLHYMGICIHVLSLGCMLKS